jgi:D-alanine-D-alanine ligase
MEKKNILLLCGGEGPEHDISLISAKYIESVIAAEPKFALTKIELKKDTYGPSFFEQLKSFDYIIPCIHGFPGETGDIQSIFEILNLPYLGAGSEASKICFNKISTKLWLAGQKIPVTPYVFIQSLKDSKKVFKFLKKHPRLFIKPSSQGSSVGCTLVTREDQIENALAEALKFSPYALVEKGLKARELEVAVFEYKNKVRVTPPGEVIITKCQDAFYSYKEKYDPSSKAYTEVMAQNLDPKIAKKIMLYSKKAFKALNIKHLSRIDFFLTEDGKIYLNEINTFPGMTPISMFPKMMENSGTPFRKFLLEKING